MIRKIFTGIVLTVFLCSFFYLSYNFWLKQENIAQKKALEKLFPIEEADRLVQQKSKDAIKFKEKTLCPLFTELKKVNKDVVGVLVIPDTDIMYPVLQKDNSFYLNHNIYGESDIYGSVFLDEKCTIKGNNYIIYGHAMKDGTMFGNLKKYQDTEYLKNHDMAYLYTEYGKWTYQFSELVLSSGEENVNTLYQTFPFYEDSHDTAEQYQVFWNEVARNTGKDMSCNGTEYDSILMLVTCSYHEENGRMMLIATKQEK